jgi:26S proteasome regulatory subunit N8
MTLTTQAPEQVIVHPLVLLSVTDHYNRSAKNTKKRVVGVLLGQQNGNQINVANSYAGNFILWICNFSLGILEL